MKKILTIIGARPQIIKAAALSRAIRTQFIDQIEEILVHTGQHYDSNMSERFFEELSIPRPDYNLGVGSGPHGAQTARMLAGIEELLEKEAPDFLVVYGDTNSTLAGAMAAAKLHIPIVHIEAGLRSFNKRMPEEINRILSDHVATYLFPPTQAGMTNLAREGFSLHAPGPYSPDNPGVFNVGDVMYDNSIFFSGVSDERVNLSEQFGVSEGNFLLATVHRNHNTDDPERLTAIFRAFDAITTQYAMDMVIPLHPRTRKQMETLLDKDFYGKLSENPFLKMFPPVSFLEMIALEKGAKAVLTDSGGVQKETFFFEKPCLILRAETEWVEIVESGAAILCDADYDRIVAAFDGVMSSAPSRFPKVYGDGHAAEKMVELLLTE